jgi:16S rRNA (guanine527-N7)-methyltransferase
MPTLSTDRIATLLTPYLLKSPIPETLYTQLSLYLDLLLKWNARTNLTAIRDPEQIIQRHFGESLFAGLQLHSQLKAQSPQPNDLTPHLHAIPNDPPPPSSILYPLSPALLDLGSGAGFPGLPIQLLHPAWRIALAESQNKKATFLREAIRTLNLPTEVWAARAETLPPTRLFEIITLRAVDNMPQALAAAAPHLAPDGLLAILTTDPTPGVNAIPLPPPSHGYLILNSAV